MLRNARTLITMVIAVIAGGACDRRVAKLSGAKIEELRRIAPGITKECLEKVRYGGIEAMPQRTEDCYEMMPSEHFRGLWRRNFEDSQFCPEPLRECSYDTPGDKIWLTISAGAGGPKRAIAGNLYAIQFIGRRTKVRGFYGHLGQSQHEVIADKVVSVAAVSRSPSASQ